MGKPFRDGNQPKRRCLAVAIADGQVAFVELPSHARTKIEELVNGDWSRLVGASAPEVRLWTDGWDDKRHYSAGLLEPSSLPSSINAFELAMRLDGYVRKAKLGLAFQRQVTERLRPIESASVMPDYSDIPPMIEFDD